MFSQPPAVSPVEVLSQLAQEGKTQLQKLELKILSLGSLNELIMVLQNNKFNINEIELSFANSLSLVDRSTFTLKFAEALKCIEGVQIFTLASSIKDYALKALLKNESMLKLKSFAMTHEKEFDHSKDPVNSKDFFENGLVAYLQDNLALESLMIEDHQNSMQSKNYPKLKSVMIKHPRLVTFKQNFFSFGVAKGQLANDDALTLAFAQKVESDPAYVKSNRAAEFENAVRRFTEVLPRMEETVHNRQRIHDNEDPWQYRIATLEQGFQKWDNFKKEYDGFTHEEADDLDRKKSIANVFCQYLKLTLNAAILLSGKEAAAYKDELEIFWDTKREDLHAAIITELKNENPDLTENLKAIQSEYDALKRIYEDVSPVIINAAQKQSIDPNVRVFPASYTAITANEADGLAKAKILLDDYTKHDSRFSRVVHFHWNRHHTKEVNRIVLRINSQEENGINTMDELKSALDGINLFNQNGSLARRIQFIKTHCNSSNENDAAQSERLVNRNV